VKPIFRSRSGEEENIPGYILDGVFRVTEGVCCVNCKHSHFFDATPLTVTLPIVLPNKKDSFAAEEVGAQETV
jgi:hypothetical protein